YLDRVIPVAALPGYLEARPSNLGALRSRRLWRHTDRRQFSVQRLWAHRLGRRVRTTRPYQHLSPPARLTADRVWHADDGAQSVGLRRSGLLCAELLRRRLRDHAVHGN